MSTTTSAKPPSSVETDGTVQDERISAGDAGEAPPVIENGAISDARRRARKRRARFFVITTASVVALAGTLAAFLIGAPGTPGAAPDIGSPAGVGSASTDASVIGRWARTHVGWVYVYDDGRVLSYHDGPPILVRQLSPAGVDLVRDGGIEPEMLLIPDGTIPAAAWLAGAASVYRPAKYALCSFNPSPDPADVLADMGLIRMTLPVAVRSLLEHAAMQSFTKAALDESGDFIGIDGYHSAPGAGTDCYVMGVHLAQGVWAYTRPFAGATEYDVRFRLGDASFAAIDGIDGSEITLISFPIMPHGGWVLWGG